jgi:hypothetical protein
MGIELTVGSNAGLPPSPRLFWGIRDQNEVSTDKYCKTIKIITIITIITIIKLINCNNIRSIKIKLNQ